MEIGSEFSWVETTAYTDFTEPTLHFTDSRLLFSGRTAIDYALEDIGRVHKAMLPAYCCQSMIQPFIRRGIECDFYAVEHAREGLYLSPQIPEDCTVLLLCNYFGFRTQFQEDTLRAFRRRGGKVIEDITHSFLSAAAGWDESDYYVASLRKWGPMLSGGVIYKRQGCLKSIPLHKVDSGFLSAKDEAMRLKARYLQTERDPALKERYLNLFRHSNETFANDISGCAMDEHSAAVWSYCCTADVCRRRRENAALLYAMLADINGIRFLFPEKSMDVPLFVPVLFDEQEKRAKLRSYLTAQDIYCPIHWPRPGTAGACSSLYDRELSLICDQRYNYEDIHREISAVKDGLRRI